jgi:DNA modification methylase
MISKNVPVSSNFGKNISNAVNYHSLPRFRWYGYKEGFSPKLVESAIREVELKKSDYILDPFNGSGTVTLTASMNNIASVGIEVNPFVAFVAKTKMENCSSKKFHDNIANVLFSAAKGKESMLETFSTFTEKSGREKWLFNNDVLRAFEGGWQATNNIGLSLRKIFRLSLIGAAMDNCNAAKDGKCLKYRNNWQNKKFGKDTFIASLKERLEKNERDLENIVIPQIAAIINNDARETIKNIPGKYKLCITSPPYLNSFDYTDIYRPELFLGKFIKSAGGLRKLRFKTIRSHIEIVLPKPIKYSFGEIYSSFHRRISECETTWSSQIPIMIQSYFEDMEGILSDLLRKAKKEGELWLVVANSIYAGIEVPVDLILAEIGTRNGWRLKKIETLRYIYRRKTNYCADIEKIRESLLVFHKA